MFPSLAAPEDVHADIAAILDLALEIEDMPRPAPAVAAEHPNAKAARETRDAAARTREWRQRQREAADVNAALADALVTADWNRRDIARRSGRHEVVVPIDLGDITRIAQESLKRQGYDLARIRALLLPRLSPARPPIAL